MRVVLLTDLEQETVAVSEFAAIEMMPILRVLKMPTTGGRELNGFLYILEGECEYSFDDQLFRIPAGGLVYLPHGSLHQYRCVSEKIRYLRIDYILNSLSDGEEILFSKRPLLLWKECPVAVRNVLRQMVEEFSSNSFGRSLRCNALLFELFYQIANAKHKSVVQNSESGKILPALEYLEEHYREEVSSEEIALLCGFSTAYFRSVFKAATGVTPTEYRNRMRVEKACQVLREEDCNISELAEQLGFNSVYYFCRCFHKMKGIAPGKYRIQQSSFG